MALTPNEINLLRARYEGQREPFVELAASLSRFITEVMEQRGRQCLIAHRAKSPASLAEKLTRIRRKKNAPTYASFDAAFSPPLDDLAGARVLVYQVEGLDIVLGDLAQAFGTAGHEVKVKRRDQDRSGYHAKHLYVSGPGAAFDKPEALPVDPVVEVQVCTLAHHIWNELSHDIGYKQVSGRPDDGLMDLLAVLRRQVDALLFTTGRLHERAAELVRRNDAPIADHQELGILLVGVEVSRTPLTGDMRGLFELLNAQIDPLTPSNLDAVFRAGISRQEAEARVAELDPERTSEDVGRILVQLLPGLDAHTVIEIASAAEATPFLMFAHRAAEAVVIM